MNQKQVHNVRHHGIATLYMVIAMGAICMLISLGVDMARVQLAKTELMRAADAAARAACSQVPADFTSAQSLAQQFANYNSADGTSVSLSASDVKYGSWNTTTKTFTALSGAALSTANAVQVTTRRSTSTNNAVPLMFASLLGARDISVASTVVAASLPVPSGYGVIGLDWVSMTGNAQIDSWKSTDGPYGASTERASGNVASNGSISINGSAGVDGDAHPGVGQLLVGGPVSGSTTQMTSTLSRPAATAGDAATNNNNASLPSSYIAADNSFSLGSQQTANFHTGTYYFNNFSTGGQSTLQANLDGPVTIYLTGNLSMGGGSSVLSSQPKNLKIIMLTAGSTASITGNTDLYVDLYAPLTALTITGTGEMYGEVVAKTVTMTGNGEFHVDETLTQPVSKRIVTVK